MEFAPIPNFRPLTAIKSWPVDPELNAVVRAENSARPGKDSSNRRPSTGAQDEDFAELSGEQQVEPAAEPDPPSEGNINLFA